jgi:hypothetical protein
MDLIKDSDLSAFVRSDFNDRRPLKYHYDESLRVEAYWRWLAANKEMVVAKGKYARVVSSSASSEYEVRALTHSMDADYEALWLNHSIGHSFEHYRDKGGLFSIRTLAGEPRATMLVSDNFIVHARMSGNAPLSQEMMEVVEAFAIEVGFEVSLDEGSLPEKMKNESQLALF